jgi:hypothetical protein
MNLPSTMFDYSLHFFLILTSNRLVFCLSPFYLFLFPVSTPIMSFCF